MTTEQIVTKIVFTGDWQEKYAVMRKYEGHIKRQWRKQLQGMSGIEVPVVRKSVKEKV